MLDQENLKSKNWTPRGCQYCFTSPNVVAKMSTVRETYRYADGRVVELYLCDDHKTPFSVEVR